MARKVTNRRTTKTKVTKPAGAPDQIVLHKIEVRPYNRTEQDIPNWRRAIQSAESQIPRRSLLYNLYADVDLDGHVEAVTGKRRDPIKAANWQFVDKEGTPVDTVNDLIDSVGFDDLLDEIMNAKFWGYSMMEPTFWQDQDGSWEMDAGLLPRLNYRPENGILSYDSYSEEGVNIREGIYAKTIMEVGKIKDLGLYMKASPYAILKRGGLGDYAVFVQTFGNPLIDAMWNGFDEKQRVQLQQALQEIGAGGTIIRPDGTTIDIKENNVNATGDAHGNFLRFLNAEISKALIGTTETTESSSSSGYAQSKTHQEQDESKHETDLNYVRRVLNSRFIRILQSAGFDTKGGRFIIQGESQELTVKDSYEMYKSMRKELGLPIDDDFFYETFDVPKPENYDSLKAEQKEQKPPVSEPKPGAKKANKKEDPDPVNLSLSEEETKEQLDNALMRWLRRFLPFFSKAPAETTGATASCGHHHTINLAALEGFDNDGLINRIWEQKGKVSFDAALFYYTASTLFKGFKEAWDKANTITLADAPGFVYGIDDPALLTAFEQNLFRFSGAKTLAEVYELNELFKKATSFREFYQMAKERLGVFNKNWLETEYTSAVLTGEAAATYNRLIKQTELYPYWKYKTAGDHLVRPEHAALNGLVLPSNDKRWDKLFPPNGWNCRCYIVPRLKNEVTQEELRASRKRADAYLNSKQFKSEALQGWGVNRAATGEVFTANQQYVHKFPGKASKMINTLKPADWGLDSYSNAKKQATEATKTYEGTAAEFFDQLESLNDLRVIKDYHKRPLQVKEGNFKRHTKGRAERVRLLEALGQTLTAPHEVWLNGAELGEMVYISYFLDKTITVRASIKNGTMELLTWYELTEKRTILNKHRNGLLVYKK